VEKPAAVAALVNEFMEQTKTMENTTGEVRPQVWTTALTRPVQGRDLVQQIMEIVSQIYDSVEFTHEAVRAPRLPPIEGHRLQRSALRPSDGLDQERQRQDRPRRDPPPSPGAALTLPTEPGKRLRQTIDPSHSHNPGQAS
jgi:hypothetical protein